MNMKIDPWVRIAIMLVAAVTIAFLSKHLTGSVLPADPKEALLFQNALLLIVLGSALLEHHYTKPADSVVNSLMGLLTLVPIYAEAPVWPWRVVAGYCGIVFLLSVTCVAVSSGEGVTGWRKRITQFTYRPSVVFGRGRILFTIVFLSGLWFFYSVQSPMTIALVLFWGAFLAIWPLRVPELITSWSHRERSTSTAIGTVVRIDNPNILRVVLDGTAAWAQDKPKLCLLPDGASQWVQPLFSQFQEERLLGTGLLTGLCGPEVSGQCNCVMEPDSSVTAPDPDAINIALGGGPSSALVGFVVERSEVGTIRFETLSTKSCHEGMLVWCELSGSPVYYQIVSGETQEESFASDKHGFQVATAVQLGTLETGRGFEKFDWLPAMNTPVFAWPLNSEAELSAINEGDFELGTIPKSRIRVGGDFVADYNLHTAILGVTGSGKTELAFDMIRHSLSKGIKVICIDLTAQYKHRLSDLNPVDLSIEGKTANELEQKLFAVDTGKFGAPDEKKALGGFAESLRTQILESVEGFLKEENGSDLGMIRLEEISNTKATLWITELYMTCLLKYSRENSATFPKTLVVVEEAHTVMPEANTMGLGDFDSKGLVGKIAQIALQGRKFGVGLLVLAQRTATVSKTVLTQCNTIISFTCYDDTSLGFLKNIFGPAHVALIPNLPKLHAVAFGPWVRSQHPIVFEVPFDASKAGGDA